MALVVASVLGLAACSDGGGGSTGPEAVTVTSISASGARYGQTVLFTVDGTALDATVVVSAPACADLQRSTTAPNESTATRAFYTCTAVVTGDSSFTASHPTAGLLRSLDFNVPKPQVTLTLSNGAGVTGDLVFTLEPNAVKATVDNFLQYVNDGFYVGTVFHRVVPGFVVQGGGYPAWGAGVPVAKVTRAPIALEVGHGLSNAAHTLAMARGEGADTATSQFFVNLVDNSALLDPGLATAGFAVFGALAVGESVLTALVAAPCAPLPPYSECAPNPAVVITAAAQSR